MNTFEFIKNLIMEQLGTEESEITMKTNINDDLKADSLDKVEMVMAAEEEFGIEINDDAAISFATVGDVVNYVDSLRKKA